MRLMNLIHHQYQTVSVVGMGKNAGKTVTLNRLIQEAAEQEIILGLTSTGRDGEKQDIVTMTEKPRIYVYKETIVATAQATFLASGAKLEILEVTDCETPMGPVIIARVKSEGLMELAGPETNHQIRDIAAKMCAYGAEIVIVDGAINRKTAASPGITQATILATGAVVSRNMQHVFLETAHQVDLFNMKGIQDENIKALAQKIFAEKGYAIIDAEGMLRMLDIPTALNSGRMIGGVLEEKSTYVLISGSLVYKTLEDIIAVTPYYKQVTFIIQDATKLFISAKEWILLKRRGIQIAVMDEIHTLAVTVNPYAPQGYHFQPEVFRDGIRAQLGGLPVVDLMLEDEIYD
ncbi:conserved hypothetical protein [Alkaliphilus metalliredigens QYMF]|uniref:Uncharacterized protein n=1 Tax=Alkaliphilus metalliredigens (strain QYMF) TaxID=293826 RepID=A6TWQ5_ALKMQ|nr:hypothetical protein [Alkaliphilus metalliredigens]ABR50623.1 conserved hypothetical protein [Alkaliphilus metalliredigens QYMF]